MIAITATAARGIEATVEAMSGLCQLAQPGSVAVHLRERELGAAALLELADRLRRVTRQFEQRLLINDRLDVAWMCGADGVHVTEQSVSALQARALFAQRGAPIWLSRAWHRPRVAPEQTGGAAGPEGVDAWVLSPVVEARKGAPAVGISGLAHFVRLARALERPAVVYALGGVRAAAARECLAAGAVGVAAIGAAYEEPEALLSALGALRQA